MGNANLGIIPTVFQNLGISLQWNGPDLIIPEQDAYEIQNFIDGSILTIYDAPWPGFTPDLISIILVVCTQAKGSVLIHQKMFEKSALANGHANGSVPVEKSDHAYFQL